MDQRADGTMTRQISDYDYHLPPEQIACRPASPRDSSRLLVLDRNQGVIRGETEFNQITDWLKPDDLLVVNDTRVIPARIPVRKADSGGALELFILSIEPTAATTLLRPARRVRPGQRLVLPDDQVVEVLESLGDGHFRLRHPLGEHWLNWLERYAEMPLPPYIARQRAADEADRQDYQTVYAADPGSVAAPTAGLHFTKGLINDIKQVGIEMVAVTLHVGPGTFKPVSTEQIEDHIMHSENFVVSPETAERIEKQRSAGGRIIAVGTTVVRVLEHLASSSGRIVPGSGNTDIFIREGFPFQIVNGMITNFHLPRSTLLMLVAAFAGFDPMMSAYRHALASDWRFYSYGDAMLIV